MPRWFRAKIRQTGAPSNELPAPKVELIQSMVLSYVLLNSIALLVLYARGRSKSKSPPGKHIANEAARPSRPAPPPPRSTTSTNSSSAKQHVCFHDPALYHADGNGTAGRDQTRRRRHVAIRQSLTRSFRQTLAASKALIGRASVLALNAAVVTGAAARTSVMHASGFHMLRRAPTAVHLKRDTAPHKVVTSLTLTFIVVILGAYFASRHFVAMSTWDFFPKSVELNAGLHILSALAWTIASAFLTIKGFYRYHRRVGYVAVASNIAMSVTAYSLAFSVFNAATGKYPANQIDWQSSLDGIISLDLKSFSPSDLDWHAINSIYHSYSNMQIAGLSPMLLGYAMVAARSHDKATHERFMGTIHLLMGTSLLPRVNAVWLRWVLPSTWSGHAIYSISVSLQWSLNFYHIGPMPNWLLSQATPIERVQRRLIWQVFLANVFVAAVNFVLTVVMYIAAEYFVNVWLISAVTTALFMYSGMVFYETSGDSERESLRFKRFCTKQA